MQPGDTHQPGVARRRTSSRVPEAVLAALAMLLVGASSVRGYDPPAGMPEPWLGRPSQFWEPVTTWKMLCLIYRSIDTEVTLQDGTRRHATSTYSDACLDYVKWCILDCERLTAVYSAGSCRLETTTVVVDRPLRNFKRNGFNGFEPTGNEWEPEYTAARGQGQYDTTAVFWNIGPGPDVIGPGYGGTGGGHTIFIPLGANLPPAAGDRIGLTWARSTIIHEWLHSLDSYSFGLGYRKIEEHRLAEAAFPPYGDNWWTSLLGRPYVEDGAYAYHSRAVWAAGTPRHTADPLPVQLLAPYDGTKFEAPPLLRWTPTPADKYRLDIYDARDDGPLVFTQETTRCLCQPPPAALRPGTYLWRVMALKEGRTSPEGDVLTFTIAPHVAPPVFEPTTVEPPMVFADGDTVKITGVVSADRGVRRAWAVVRTPDGVSFELPQQLRLPLATEPHWECDFQAPPNELLEPATYTVQCFAEDFGGERSASEPVALRVAARTGYGDGLAATYCNSADGSNPVLRRIDGRLNFQWSGPPAPEVNAAPFSAFWTGFVSAPVSGSYRFYLKVDDGARLWLGSRKLIDFWRQGPPEERSATATLAAGELTPLRVEYFNGGGPGSVTLAWSGPGFPQQTIPRCQLFSQPDADGRTTDRGACEIRVSATRHWARASDGAYLPLSATVENPAQPRALWVEISGPHGPAGRISLVPQAWFLHHDSQPVGVFHIPANTSGEAEEYQVQWVVRDGQGREDRSQRTQFKVMPFQFLTLDRAVLNRCGCLTARANACIDGKPLRIGDRVFTQGIGTHAPAELVFLLEGKYRWLTFYTGIRGDLTANPSSVTVQVWLDGKLAYETPVMRMQEQPRYVSLPVEGTRELRLVCTDAGDGNNSDHVSFGNLRLTTAAEPPEPETAPLAQADADAAPGQPLLDFATPGIESRVQVNEGQTGVTYQVVDGPAGKALEVTCQPNQTSYPGVLLLPDGPSWDLSAFKYVAARVVNTGPSRLYVALRVDNAGPWQTHPWNVEGGTLQPGESVTGRVYFGRSWGKPDFALDPSKVTRIGLTTGKSDQVQTFRIESVVAGRE